MISGILGLVAIRCCTCTWPERILFSNRIRLAGDMTLEADLFSWRLDRFDSGSATLALAGDGSFALRYTHSSSRLLGLVRRQTSLQHAQSANGLSFGSDEDGKVYRYQGGPPPLPTPVDTSDTHCERARHEFSPKLNGAPKFGTVAGYSVVIYEGDHEDESGSVAFAPDLGCLVMRSSYRQRNRFGIPIEISWWEVTGVRRGRPDPSLFTIPKGRIIVAE
jgi:hypothetical protein